ncbi:MAG: GNAT family N-acetyltransferase [Actinomycetota bacterium]
MDAGLATDIIRVDRGSLAQWRDGITSVYAQVFQAAPWHETDDTVTWFGGEWLDYCVRLDSFRCFAATRDDTVVGFSMGLRFEEHHDWFSALAKQLELDPSVDWLSDTFFVHELAVLQTHRGCGIGSGLHDALLASTPSPLALLTTNAVGPAPAAVLFARRGWKFLLESWEARPGDSPQHVMGLRKDEP